MPGTERAIAIYDTPAEAVRAAADWFTARAGGSVCLAGGRTPEALYQLLACDDYRGRIDWDGLDIYFGDERAVPPNHPDSNYGMARRSLLDLVPIDPDRVHRMEADASDLDAAAAAYDDLLPDELDVVLLGLGGDGHTASLFPGEEALDEDDRRCVATRNPDGQARLTLTYPALNAARHVLFLVIGADKREALARIRRGDDLPAAHVRPVRGDVLWIADAAAT